MTTTAVAENTDTTEHEHPERKVVITLTSAPAAFTRRLSRRMGVTVPEVVRRGLTVLDLLVSLGPDEELVVRNRKTKEMERVRFQWGVEG